MSLISDFGTSFILGLLTPLTAVCVLPLYPAFVAFLSSRFSGKEKRSSIFLFGVIILIGILLFMLSLGLIFTTFLQKSLTSIIGIISPIAFAILGIISLFLILDIDFSRFMPKFQIKTSSSPLRDAIAFGFFFGAIVIPCNPAFIAAFFARAFLFEGFFSSILGFFGFGLGLGTPLLILSIVSGQWSKQIIGFLIKHKRKINLIAGVIMLLVSIYYLFFVFKII